jgi:hypothetical protein
LVSKTSEAFPLTYPRLCAKNSTTRNIDNLSNYWTSSRLRAPDIQSDVAAVAGTSADARGSNSSQTRYGPEQANQIAPSGRDSMSRRQRIRLTNIIPLS